MKIYKLVFKQLQPIHIGAGAYGVISETRIFIPGWTMWGALTKAYNLQKGNALSENQSLFENISCFYPSFDEEGDTVMFPEFKGDEFYLGKYSEKEFRAKFVDTYTSTAILPNSRMAKDKSLHEINVILPGVKKDYREEKNEEQLYWIGIIGFEDDREIKDFLKDGLRVYIGGDVRYGFGVIELVKKGKVKKEDVKEFLFSNFIPLYLIKGINGKIEILVEVKGYKGARLKIEENKKRYCFVPNRSVGEKFKNFFVDNFEKIFSKKGVLEK